MDGREEQTHYVKRVVLPSGKTIEVVYFKDAHGAPLEPVPVQSERAGRQPAVEPRQDLTLCGGCDSRLVYPVEWEEAGPENWSVILECPNCGRAREGVFAQDTVERFDEQLDAGADALTRDYKRLMRANMADEIDRFVAALEADAILPEDF